MKTQTFTIKEFMNEPYSHRTIHIISKPTSQLSKNVNFIIKVVIISGVIYFLLFNPVPAY
jgi:hypothetical protein